MVSTTHEEKMRTVRFRVAATPHIVVDSRVCRDCSTHACTYVCPANLFVLLEDGSILFNYEQCFECGTCYIACNREGAIQWSYPDGGHGVTFRES
jgi:ferredoxin like protein